MSTRNNRSYPQRVITLGMTPEEIDKFEASNFNTCKKCNVEKPLSGFTKDKRCPLTAKFPGYDQQCKQCKNESKRLLKGDPDRIIRHMNGDIDRELNALPPIPQPGQEQLFEIKKRANVVAMMKLADEHRVEWNRYYQAEIARLNHEVAVQKFVRVPQ